MPPRPTTWPGGTSWSGPCSCCLRSAAAWSSCGTCSTSASERSQRTSASAWGLAGGSWEANGAAIVASVASADCQGAADWVDGWSTYVLADGDWTVRDAGGSVVGRMVDGDATPELVPPELATQPGPSTVGSWFDEPARLPEGLRPAEPADLVGRWVPATGDPGPDRAYVELTAQGRWWGHDGCEVHAGGGRWAVDAAGRLLKTEATPLNLLDVECPGGTSTSSLISAGSRVGLDGGTLVLLHRTGAELGRLVPEGTPRPGPTARPEAAHVVGPEIPRTFEPHVEVHRASWSPVATGEG